MGRPLNQLVTFSVKPERRADFLAALADVLAHARREPANTYLHTTESAEEPGRFVFFEKWRDRDEFVNVIQQRPYFRRYVATTQSMLVGRPVTTVLHRVPEPGLPWSGHPNPCVLGC
ncbi:hypothetical protein Val02_31270 [Virgisporangium aliadipatigenens]|uniref:ABM domain-containing protein n=1 Tax=Virgisporangium aliadipatigenens TaxID=741659 RepID=A0A8J4DQQ1_9ACTN|nr:putative quinol monooxygenase [Virgisporangium aliadipatigenens]GIJ46241.1 hypothetical protein Val02_31270 [Virgisporangium aliadipatigenens]